MLLTELIWNIGASLLQFIIGLVLAIFSVFLGIRVLDALTKGLDEWKEIKKGNTAVGILVASVVLSVAIVIAPTVSSISLTAGPEETADLVLEVIIICINLVISIVAAMIGIYFAITVFDQLTPDINDLKELKKGNTAMALVLAAVVIAVAFVIQGAVISLVNTLDVASFFGF